jgi:hypothetical protein
MKPKLVTVTSGRTNILRHHINHYKDSVSDICVILYKNNNSPKNLVGEVEDLLKEFGLKLFQIKDHRPNDWVELSRFYNLTKYLHPNDWWIIADDDEFHVYWKNIEEIIAECEENNWQYVSGGFLDRVGIDGVFPEIKPDSNLWELFPMAGYYGFLTSGACPNKVTLCKGHVEVTIGQHYAKENGERIGPKKLNHPWRYPVHSFFTQVHHFKWDESVVGRIKNINLQKTRYSCPQIYQKMYETISNNNFKINVNDPKFMFHNSPSSNYYSYPHWNKVSNRIMRS